MVRTLAAVILSVFTCLFIPFVFAQSPAHAGHFQLWAAPGPLTPGQDRSEATCAVPTGLQQERASGAHSFITCLPFPASLLGPPRPSPGPVPLGSPPETPRRRLLLEKPNP